MRSLGKLSVRRTSLAWIEVVEIVSGDGSFGFFFVGYLPVFFAYDFTSLIVYPRIRCQRLRYKPVVSPQEKTICAPQTRSAKQVACNEPTSVRTEYTLNRPSVLMHSTLTFTDSQTARRKTLYQIRYALALNTDIRR